MGLFSFRKKTVQKTPSKNKDLHEQLVKEERELQEQIKKQDEFIDRKNNAEQRYKETGNIEEYKSFYQNEFEDESVLKMYGSWFYRYIENLIEAKEYNEAWARLNQITMYQSSESIGRISDLRFKILKKEDRNHVDAIYHLMVATMCNFIGIVGDKKIVIEQTKPSFLRKAKPLSKKAGFNDLELEYLYYLIECETLQGKCSEAKLRNSYSGFLKERSV